MKSKLVDGRHIQNGKCAITQARIVRPSPSFACWQKQAIIWTSDNNCENFKIQDGGQSPK